MSESSTAGDGQLERGEGMRHGKAYEVSLVNSCTRGTEYCTERDPGAYATVWAPAFFLLPT